MSTSTACGSWVYTHYCHSSLSACLYVCIFVYACTSLTNMQASFTHLCSMLAMRILGSWMRRSWEFKHSVKVKTYGHQQWEIHAGCGQGQLQLCPQTHNSFFPKDEQCGMVINCLVESQQWWRTSVEKMCMKSASSCFKISSQLRWTGVTTCSGHNLYMIYNMGFVYIHQLPNCIKATWGNFS